MPLLSKCYVLTLERRSVKKSIKGMKSNNGGFTLLEVLVAMIILTVVCVPLLRSFATSAQTNARAKIQAKCTTASENIMEKIRNMPTEDILTSFSTASGDEKHIDFIITDNDEMDADLPDGYTAEVSLFSDYHTTSGVVDDIAYPNANGLNMSDFSPISVRDCAIYTMPSGYDKEAYDHYVTKSIANGTNKDWEYFRKELTRDIIFEIEDTGIPYTDDDGNTKNAVKVKMTIQYYCNPSSIVDTADRKYISTQVYLYDNTASHKDLNGIYLFYYPRYEAATRGDATRRDVIEVKNPAGIKSDIYVVAMNNCAYDLNTKRDDYRLSGKGLKMIVTDGASLVDGKGSMSLKTNLLKTSATTGLRTPYFDGDTATDYGLGLDISYTPAGHTALTNSNGDDLIKAFDICDIDGKKLNKDDPTVRIYKVVVVVRDDNGNEMSRMEGSKLRHE